MPAGDSELGGELGGASQLPQQEHGPENGNVRTSRPKRTPTNTLRSGTKSAGNSPSSPAGTLSRKDTRGKKKVPITRERSASSSSQVLDSSLVDVSIVPASETAAVVTTYAPNCPCGLRNRTDVYKIDCSKCKREWHQDCLSMSGLNGKEISKMLDYLCPFCYVPPASHVNTSPNVCFTCKNTENLRNLALWQEIQSISEKFSYPRKVDAAHSSANEGLSDRMYELTNQIKTLTEEVRAFKTVVHIPSLDDKSSTSIESLEKICATITSEVESLAKGTSAISSVITALGCTVSKMPQEAQPKPKNPPQHHHHVESVAPLAHGLTAMANHIEDFISVEERESLLSFLNSADKDFQQENGRSVLGYGEPYHYPGSKTNKLKTDFPDIIQSLVTRINSQFNPPEPFPWNSNQTTPGPEVNQCLINKYTGLAGIPEHSDDERMIDPHSSIFTVSVGAECTIVFRDKTSNETTKHNCLSGSLYSMSRVSQDFFTHKIPMSDMGDSVRYSLTFRRSHWTYGNALLVVGDSNTKKLKFGTGPDTLGFASPGMNRKAARIEHINPIECCSYPNVAVLCGINDLKDRDVSRVKVELLYARFKSKIEQIRSLNNKCNLYIYPILPTRSAILNERALHFNYLIFNDMLHSSSCGIVEVCGMNDLLDRNTQRLSSRLSFDGDDIHLNNLGVKILARSLKRAIYVLKTARQGGRVYSAKSYAAAASEGVACSPG